MTWRIYLRHPQQRVTDKTTTEDQATAQVALARLCLLHAGEPIAAALTRDGRGVDYVELDQLRRCEDCGQMMPVILGDQCPRCYLVDPPLLPCPVCHGAGRLDTGERCGYCVDGLVEGCWGMPVAGETP